MNRRKRLPPTLAALALFLAFQCVAVRAQDRNELAASPLSSAPYRTGERLSYDVAFSNFPTAAHVELLIAGRGTYFGREGIELRAHVETLEVVSAALYSINNDYTTYVAPGTGLPFRAQQVIREGARSADVASDYNQPAGTSALPSKLTSPAGTYDFLSALYRLRALPLAQGLTYRFTVQNNATQYDAELKVTGREIIKTNVGSSNAIATRVRVIGNRQANDYRVQIYFSDDERHVPMLITARHPAGEIRAELASSEFLNDTPPEAPTTPQASPPPTASTRPKPVPRGTEGDPGTPAAPLRDLPFSVGEQLNFNFFMGDASQPIGTASFQVRARSRYFNQDGLLLAAVMQTTGAGQRLFPVNDQINSYVDVTTLLPFRTELRLQEGRRRANWTVNLKQDLGTAMMDDGTRLEIPIGTHDLVSVFYALRSFDLTPPKRNAVSLLINKRPRALIVTALRRETILLGSQRISAVQLSLETDDQQQGDRFALRLWVSTDTRRLPLRLTAVTPLGPVRADLAIIPVTQQ